MKLEVRIFKLCDLNEKVKFKYCIVFIFRLFFFLNLECDNKDIFFLKSRLF